MGKKVDLLWGLLLMAFALPFASASGLQLYPNNIDVAFTAGGTANVNFSIINEESFYFYNVTFENNPYIRFDTPITNLASGENRTVTAKVFGATPSAQQIRLKGFYIASVGQPMRTHQVNVTPFQSNPCDMTITQGDSIVWRSSVLSQISMVDADAQLPVDGSTMTVNQTYLKQFPSAGTFRYYFSLGGFQFPETCTITILDDSGLVNDPLLDAVLTLRATASYEPTTLSAIIPVTNYSLLFYETQDGILSISNSGTKPAKAIHLEGEWFSFNRNDFDLEAGKTVAVAYTITPLIINTTQTNQTYTKSLSISGNFPTVQQNFSITIPYSSIGENATDTARLSELLDNFCAEHPKSKFCDPDPEVVYKTVGNGTSQEINISVTQEALRNFFLTAMEQKEIQQTQVNAQKEALDTFKAQLTAQDQKIEIMMNTTMMLVTQMQNSDESFKQTFTIAGLVIMAGIIGVLIFIYRKKLTSQNLQTWTRTQ